MIKQVISNICYSAFNLRITLIYLMCTNAQITTIVLAIFLDIMYGYGAGSNPQMQQLTPPGSNPQAQ